MMEDKILTKKEEIERFLKKDDKEQFSTVTTYAELKPKVRLARKHSAKVIGCDLKNLGRKNLNFLKKTKITVNDKKSEKSLLTKREARQAKIMLKYAKISEKPVFASVGAYHLRRSSVLLKELKNQDVTIYVPTYKNKILLGQKKRLRPENVKFLRQNLKK
jgi:hypothetical protein